MSAFQINECVSEWVMESTWKAPHLAKSRIKAINFRKHTWGKLFYVTQQDQWLSTKEFLLCRTFLKTLDLIIHLGKFVWATHWYLIYHKDLHLKKYNKCFNPFSQRSKLDFSIKENAFWLLETKKKYLYSLCF